MRRWGKKKILFHVPTLMYFFLRTSRRQSGRLDPTPPVEGSACRWGRTRRGLSGTRGRRFLRPGTWGYEYETTNRARKGLVFVSGLLCLHRESKLRGGFYSRLPFFAFESKFGSIFQRLKAITTAKKQMGIEAPVIRMLVVVFDMSENVVVRA